MFIGSYRLFQHISDQDQDQCHSPGAFEYDVNPVIHRPYLGTLESDDVSEHSRITSKEQMSADIAADESNENESSSPPSTIGNTSSSSTRYTSLQDTPTHQLDTPASEVEPATTNRSPNLNSSTPKVEAEFQCSLCQEAFSRRCDLK